MKALRMMLPVLAAVVTAALAYSPAMAADEVRMPVRADVFSCGPNPCEGGTIEMEGNGIHIAQSPVGESETVRSLSAATENWNLAVTEYGYVALEVNVTIRDQGACASGPDGALTPAWVRMVYSDSDGQVREVYRGFYIPGSRGCDGGENQERVKRGKPTRYVSGNLMTLESPPTAIHYFEFGGAGVSFDASIALTLCVGSGEVMAKELATSEISWGRLKSLSFQGEMDGD